MMQSFLTSWVQEQDHIPAGMPIKLAATAPTDPISQAEVTEALNSFQFNGLSVAQNQANGNFMLIGTGTGPTDTTDRQAAATKLAAFAPHVVLILGQGTEGTLIPIFEAAWSTNVPAAPYLPWYMLSEGVGSALATPKVIVGMTNPESVRERVLASNIAPSAAGPYFSANAAYLTAYAGLPEGRSQTYPTVPQLGEFADAAVMSIVSLMAVAANKPPSYQILGSDVAHALMTATQPPNKPLDLTDVTFFADAEAAIRAGGGINYNGAMGPDDFDTLGDAWSEQAASCINPNYLEAGAPPVVTTGFFVDAPALGTLFTTATEGNACYVGMDAGGCLGGVGEGMINAGTGPHGCAYNLPDAGDGGLPDGG
jgi:hypothetical protein